MDTIMEYKEVSKVYKSGPEAIWAIKDLNLTIKTGKIYSIEGPSGSGKSTLLHLAGGLIRPTAGDILYLGKTITDYSKNEKQAYWLSQIGFVFQFDNLIPFLKVKDNISLPLEIANVSKQERLNRIELLLKIINLEKRKDHFPEELSGGEKQRVAIAIALANNPKFIIADEPTGELDSENALNIIRLFTKVRDEYNTTILLATHSDEVASLADIRIIIKNGKINS